MVVFLISILLLAGYSGLILYYRSGWMSLPPAVSQPGSIAVSRFSIIVPARNEEQYIGSCIQSLLAQDYPASMFEILVVDDHSSDQTPDIVKSIGDKRVRLLSLEDLLPDGHVNSYKKKAIETAIGLASNEIIVATDADCRVPPGWLAAINSAIVQKNAAFLAMPVVLDSNGSFLQDFQQLDFLTLQGITGASVHRRFHSMCNGANLAYSKSVFHEVGGFEGVDEIASGDDMLLMHKVFMNHPEAVFFIKSPELIVASRSADSWKGFFRQRIRWASKAGKYKDRRIFFALLLVYLFNFNFLVLVVSGIFYTWHWYLLAGLLLSKTAIELCFLFSVAGFFELKRKLIQFPIMQPFHILYTIIAGFLGSISKYEWKGRIVK